MTRTRLFSLLSIAILALVAAAPSDRGDECEMKTVVRGFWCETCRLGMEKSELASNVTYYFCDGCETAAPAEGKCPDCGHPLTKKTSGKDVCKKCFKKPIAADLCIKQGFVCSKCFAGYAAAGKCEIDKTTLTAGSVPALVKYECSECKTVSPTAGKCTKAGCKGNGTDLQKKCSKSGRAPHVAAK